MPSFNWGTRFGLLRVSKFSRWYWLLTGRVQETSRATSNPRWPTLITHSQGQESNEDATPLEQLDGTTLFLGHAETGEIKGGGREGGKRGKEEEDHYSRRRRDNLPSSCLSHSQPQHNGSSTALQQWHSVAKTLPVRNLAAGVFLHECSSGSAWGDISVKHRHKLNIGKSFIKHFILILNMFICTRGFFFFFL